MLQISLPEHPVGSDMRDFHEIPSLTLNSTQLFDNHLRLLGGAFQLRLPNL